MFQALKYINAPSTETVYDISGVEDVSLELNTECALIGKDIVTALKFQNKSGQLRTISVVSTVHSMMYTGVIINKISVVKDIYKLKPNEEKSVVHRVGEAKYYDRLQEDCHIVTYVLAIVRETDQTCAKKQVYELPKPNLTIHAPGVTRVGQRRTLTLTFVNPLNRTIQKLEYAVVGKRFEVDMIPFGGTLKAHEKFEHNVAITPTQVGLITVYATVVCDDIFDVSGKLTLRVRDGLSETAMVTTEMGRMMRRHG